MKIKTQFGGVLLWLGAIIVTACGVSTTPGSAPTATPLRMPSTTPQPLQSIVLTPTVVPTGNSDTWKRGWLLGQPCEPPCWEGITPGKTSREEALAILGSKSYITDVDGILPSNPSDDQGSIGWIMIPSTSRAFGVAVFDNDKASYPIRFIRLELPGAFQLSEVITRYGPPSHVIALAGRPRHERDRIYYGINFIFLGHGFALYRENLTLDDRLKETMYVSGIDFFEPTLDSFPYWRFAPYYEAPPHSALQPWHGFDTFAAYCQPAEEGDLDACAPPSR